jgi:hypothetical protein
MVPVLAHVLHAAVEPLALLLVPGAIVIVWEWRSRRAKATD